MKFGKETIIFIIFALLLTGCSLFKSVVSTLPDIARTLCMFAAAERSASDRDKKSDDLWCVEHAAEYLEEVGRAKAAASRKAGLHN